MLKSRVHLQDAFQQILARYVRSGEVVVHHDGGTLSYMNGAKQIVTSVSKGILFRDLRARFAVGDIRNVGGVIRISMPDPAIFLLTIIRLLPPGRYVAQRRAWNLCDVHGDDLGLPTDPDWEKFTEYDVEAIIDLIPHCKFCAVSYRGVEFTLSTY